MEFLSPKAALALTQAELPKIQGRGRQAEPYELPAEVIEIGEAVAAEGGETNAPIAVGIAKVEGKVPSNTLAELVKMNRASKGDGYHFVVRSTEDGTATVYVVAGEQPERKTREAKEDSASE